MGNTGRQRAESTPDERKDKHQRERLVQLARSAGKELSTFVREIEEACPPGTPPAEALLDAAVVMAEQDQLKPALALLERSAALYEEQHDTAGLARVYVNMGPVYGMLGNIEKGISCSLKAETLAHDLPPDSDLILHYASDLGGMYTETEQWDEAMRYFQLACDTARGTGNKELEADALLIMSQVAIAQGNAGRARELADQGGAVGIGLADKGFQARALQTLGDAEELNGRHQCALELFQKALDMEADQSDAELRQQLFWEMSEAYEQLGNTELAEDYRSRAAEIGGDEAESGD